jgi:Cu/Ag efflux protein CusF
MFFVYREIFMNYSVLGAVTAAAFAFSVPAAIAQDHSAHTAHTVAAKADSQALSEGTIKKLDKAAGKITLAHGRIENLDMAPMTMGYELKPGVLPASLKEGDKVRFRAEQKDGRYIVVRIEAAK